MTEKERVRKGKGWRIEHMNSQSLNVIFLLSRLLLLHPLVHLLLLFPLPFRRSHEHLHGCIFVYHRHPTAVISLREKKSWVRSWTPTVVFCKNRAQQERLHCLTLVVWRKVWLRLHIAEGASLIFHSLSSFSPRHLPHLCLADSSLMMRQDEKKERMRTGGPSRL